RSRSGRRAARLEAAYEPILASWSLRISVPSPSRTVRAAAALALVVLAAGVLGYHTVAKQIELVGDQYLFERGEQFERHRQVLAGEAPDPWQYRVLSPLLVEGWLRLEAAGLGFDEFRPPRAMIRFRLAQNFCLFLLVAAYFRKLGAGLLEILLAFSILTWNLFWASGAGSDLSFNTYFDAIFFLLAALAILYRRDGWVVAIAAVAAFNRETGLAIPLLLLSARLGPAGRSRWPERRSLATVGLASLLQVGIYVGLRLHYGPREPFHPYGVSWGLDLVLHNVRRAATWDWQLSTFALVPLVALLAYARWPRVVRRFFWALVPVWVVTHAALTMWEETRLFLVPHLVVLLPGAVLGVTVWRREVEMPSDRPESPPRPVGSAWRRKLVGTVAAVAAAALAVWLYAPWRSLLPNVREELPALILAELGNPAGRTVLSEVPLAGLHRGATVAGVGLVDDLEALADGRRILVDVEVERAIGAAAAQPPPGAGTVVDLKPRWPRSWGEPLRVRLHPLRRLGARRPVMLEEVGPGALLGRIDTLPPGAQSVSLSLHLPACAAPELELDGVPTRLLWGRRRGDGEDWVSERRRVPLGRGVEVRVATRCDPGAEAAVDAHFWRRPGSGAESDVDRLEAHADPAP
ncbi:MAG: hypothetical protein R3190_13825, partial [Thermoanaerobaculia bacterium]|nr:hypothetical protein [Thermoanaerobaculia bacterium]